MGRIMDARSVCRMLTAMRCRESAPRQFGLAAWRHRISLRRRGTSSSILLAFLVAAGQRFGTSSALAGGWLVNTTALQPLHRPCVAT